MMKFRNKIALEMHRVTVRRSKVNLYNDLLRLPTKEMTKTEQDLCFLLSKDADIQAVLEKARVKANAEMEKSKGKSQGL